MMNVICKKQDISPEDIEFLRENTEESARKRRIPVTIDPCILSLNNEAHNLRIAMSCGHAITPNCQISFIFGQLKKGRHQILCPYINPSNPQKKCEAHWKFSELQKVAMFSKQESMLYEYMSSENIVRKQKNMVACSKCGHYMQHDGIRKKVICRNCVLNKVPNPAFCYNCLRPWFQSRSEDCGNKNCETNDEQIFGTELKKCGKYDAPLIQRCPNCSIPIEHIGPTYCKSMLCICGYKFCWASLKGDFQENWKGAKYYLIDEIPNKEKS